MVVVGKILVFLFGLLASFPTLKQVYIRSKVYIYILQKSDTRTFQCQVHIYLTFVKRKRKYSLHLQGVVISRIKGPTKPRLYGRYFFPKVGLCEINSYAVLTPQNTKILCCVPIEYEAE